MGPGGSWCRRLGQETLDTGPPLGPQTRASGSSQQEAEDTAARVRNPSGRSLQPHRGLDGRRLQAAAEVRGRKESIRACVADHGQGALRAKGKKRLEERPSAGTRGTQQGVADGKTLNPKQDRARQEQGREPTNPQHGPRGLSVPPGGGPLRTLPPPQGAAGAKNPGTEGATRAGSQPADHARAGRQTAGVSDSPAPEALGGGGEIRQVQK